MATATRKSSRTTPVKPESISSAISFLEELPEKQKEDLSLREAIRQMQDTIKAALNRGYSYEDIAKMLSERGIQISALTLKNYAPSGKRQVTKTKARRSKKSAEAASNNEATDSVETSAPEESEPVPAKRRGRRPASAAQSEEATEATEKPKRGRPKAEAKPTRGRRTSKASS